jgi:hypothetical protein
MGGSQIGITEQDPTRLEARRQNGNAAFITRVAYRNPGMAASGMFSREGYRPLLSGGGLADELHLPQRLPGYPGTLTSVHGLTLLAAAPYSLGAVQPGTRR